MNGKTGSIEYNTLVFKNVKSTTQVFMEYTFLKEVNKKINFSFKRMYVVIWVIKEKNVYEFKTIFTFINWVISD